MIDIPNELCPVKVGGEDVLLELDSFLATNYTTSSVFILCDSNTLEHCLPKIDWLELTQLKDADVLEVEPGESAKSPEVYFQLCQSLQDLGADRNSVIVNLGGGVVTDLGGFVASTFKRGIDFINVPTSLLAMVDASIGGKTGINLGASKNQIGTITQPKAVFTSTAFLETLSKEEFDSGKGEMLKHLLISDKDALSKLSIIEGDISEDGIASSIQVKLNLVAADVNEKGERKALNYGHTFGHAIESFLIENQSPIAHGKAVLLGILLENNLAVQLGLLNENSEQEIRAWILSSFDFGSAIQVLNPQKITDYLRFDKKVDHAQINFSLIGPIGSYHINVEPTDDQISSSFSVLA